MEADHHTQRYRVMMSLSIVVPLVFDLIGYMELACRSPITQEGYIISIILFLMLIRLHSAYVLMMVSLELIVG